MNESSPLMALALTGGDWVIWALLASSVWAAAIMHDRWKLLKEEGLALASLRGPLRDAGDDAEAAAKALKARPCSAARVLLEVLDAGGGHAGLEHLAAALSDERRHLEGRLMWLGTLGNNAPFVGLFGTVLGVIKAFKDLAASGAGPEVVMAGLSEALIATAVGLLVAIPCVLAYNGFQKKVKDLLSETEALGRRLAAAKAGARR